MLGKLQPDFFPALFGPQGNEALDADTVHRQFAALAARIGHSSGRELKPEEVAAGFLQVAVDNMANAIKKVSVARGYNVTQYTLQCFGGAAGQHACLIADAVGMAHIYIPRHAGVLSAYGLGLADVTTIVSRTIELPLGAASRPLLEAAFGELAAQARARLAAEGFEAAQISCQRRVHARYEGTDTALLVDDGTEVEIQSRFESAYRRRYSFLIDNKPLVINAVSIAEQRGLRLANTAYSVNSKERLDFSCALFHQHGSLIANAPHMPVHLGSMGESVRTVIRENTALRGRPIRPGDVYMLNAPYNGGTHLPDITVITPVFDPDGARVLFYVGSRGHHADVGGLTPGSIPSETTRGEE